MQYLLKVAKLLIIAVILVLVSLTLTYARPIVGESTLTTEGTGMQLLAAPLVDQPGVPSLDTSVNTIAYAPSLTILSRVITRVRHRSCEAESRALAVGNPTGWPNLSSLERSETVVREIANRFGEKPLLRDAATKQEVIGKLSTARVVFFVCHGYFNRQIPLYSGLYLTRTGNGDELEDILTIREIMQMRLSADLVVLSACQSGLNLVRRGDELIGLARAFLYAGVSTVVVALWSVSEASATELMRDFFHRLYPEGRKKLRL